MTDIVPHSNGSNGTPVPRFNTRGIPDIELETGARSIEDESIDLHHIFGVLRRNALLVLAFTVICGALAGWMAFRAEPVYTAKAWLRIRNQRQAITGTIAGPGMPQVMGATVDPLLSELQVLRSPSMLAGIADQLGLRLMALGGLSTLDLQGVDVAVDAPRDTIRLAFARDGYRVTQGRHAYQAQYGVPVQLNGVRFAIAQQPASKQATFAVIPRSQVVSRLAGTLVARPVEKTDVVEVVYTSTDPRVAQAIVNTAVDVYHAASTAKAQQESRRRREFIQQQLIKTEGQLGAAQDALSAFRQREGVLSSREEFASEQMSRMELDLKRQELISERGMLNTLLAQLKNGNEEEGLRSLVSAPSVAENPVIVEQYTRLVQYRAARDSMIAGGRSTRNANVKGLDALIASSQKELAAAVGSQIRTMDVRIAAMENMRNSSTTEMKTMPAKEAEQMRLEQRLEISSQIAKQLREEFQKASIAEAVEAGQVEVVDRADLPLVPVPQRKSLKVLLGLTFGLLLGAGAGFLRESLNTKITRKDEIEPLLGIPELAVIPKLDNNGPAPQRTLLGRRIGVAKSNGKAVAVARPLQELVTFNDVRSSGAEAYRSLRTNLIFSHASSSLRSLMITSPMPSEGKTTTAANLAVAFAQQGLNVIMVDLDLRKARLHRVFGVTREPGATDVLVGVATLDEAVRTTGVENLSVLPAGTLSPNPSELLGGNAMKTLLSDLQERCDLVIVDAAPVMVAGDSSIIGTLVEGAVLVVRAGQTDRVVAEAALRQLRIVGTHMLGAVLNDPDATVARYDAYYYQSYAYQEAAAGE